MKTIRRLVAVLILGLTFISCTNDDSIEEVIPPVLENCDCYTQTIQINQSNDTIYKSEKIYGQNLGLCGEYIDLVIPNSNPFITNHYITNCNLN